MEEMTEANRSLAEENERLREENKKLKEEKLSLLDQLEHIRELLKTNWVYDDREEGE